MSGWQEHFDPDHQRKYWHNAATGETTWWEEFLSEEHQRKYWHNPRTGR
eukprot:gene20949-53955_t